jgi:type II secretory pathway pseudopilin PulG
MSGDTRYSNDFRFSIFEGGRLKGEAFGHGRRARSHPQAALEDATHRQSAIRRGFLLTELIVSLSVLGLLLAGLAMSLDGFAKFNRYQLTRQHCIAAAQAELDSIAATGRPIPDEDFSRLWPKLSVAIKEISGAGQWQAMTLVKVTTSGKSYRKDVEIQLSRYIQRDEPLAKGKQ